MAYPDHYYCGPVWLIVLYPCWLRHESCHLTEAIQDYLIGVRWYVFILLFDMPEGPGADFSIAMEDGKFS